VLDTNAALDWLVFGAPSMTAVAVAISGGHVRWLACASMRLELEHMLKHPSLARWQHDPAVALQIFDSCAVHMPEPQLGADVRLRCTDPDDQVFIDLAIATPAHWLLTHDHALLKLAKRARRLGVQVLRPADWPGPAPLLASAPTEVISAQ